MRKEKKANDELKSYSFKSPKYENKIPFFSEACFWNAPNNKSVAAIIAACLSAPSETISTLLQAPASTSFSPDKGSLAWIDPNPLKPDEERSMVAEALKIQINSIDSKVKVKMAIDPDTTEIFEMVRSAALFADENRVLFYYYGVLMPPPSEKGEVWIYSPNSRKPATFRLVDLVKRLKTPGTYVFDCSGAGRLTKYLESASWTAGSRTPIKSKSSFLFGLFACGRSEILPKPSNFPEDIFTACLTTPIRLAAKWHLTMRASSFLIRRPTSSSSSTTNIYSSSEEIIFPGKSTARKTMLGEITWIFTAVTDTIAWNVLPRHLFNQLLREDPLTSSLFRNYILAERVMRSFKCTPETIPMLPPTFTHKLWGVWDMTLDFFISQLSNAKGQEKFTSSNFFDDQLRAFELWIESGLEKQEGISKLPILLQALVGQAFRPRAMTLLARFLSAGSWAIREILDVGVFFYLTKIITSNHQSTRKSALFIWAKIISYNEKCYSSLVNDGAMTFIENVISTQKQKFSSEDCCYAFIILSVIASAGSKKTPRTRSNILAEMKSSSKRRQNNETLSHEFLSIAISFVASDMYDPRLREWAALFIAKLWEWDSSMKQKGIEEEIHLKLLSSLGAIEPNIRSAVVHALACLVSNAVIDTSAEYSEASEDGPFSEAIVDSRFSFTGPFSDDNEEDGAIITSYLSKIEDAMERIITHVRHLSSEGSFEVRAELLNLCQTMTYVYNSELEDSRDFTDDIFEDSRRSFDKKSIIVEYLRSIVNSMALDPNPEIAAQASKTFLFETSPKNTPPSTPPMSPRLDELFGSPKNEEIDVRRVTFDQIDRLSPFEASILDMGISNESYQPEISRKNTSQKISLYTKKIVEFVETGTLWDDNLEAGIPFQIFDDVDYSLLFEKDENLRKIDFLDSEFSLRNRFTDQVLNLKNDTKTITPMLSLTRVGDQRLLPRVQIHEYKDYILALSTKGTFHQLGWNRAPGKGKGGKNALFLEKTDKFEGCEKAKLFELINKKDEELVLTGYQTGVVKVWDPGEYKGLANPNSKGWSVWNQVASWELFGTSGLLQALGWDQGTETVLASRDSRQVTIWDARSEKGIMTMNSRQTAGNLRWLTREGKLVFAGFSTNAFSVFDVRVETPKDQIVLQVEPNLNSGQCVSFKTTTGAAALEIVTAKSKGEVRFWDARALRESSRKTNILPSTGKHEVITLDTHSSEDALIASIKDNKGQSLVKIYDFDGKELVGETIMDKYSKRKVKGIALHRYKGVAALSMRSEIALMDYDL